jgi:hypothetical protein
MDLQQSFKNGIHSCQYVVVVNLLKTLLVWQYVGDYGSETTSFHFLVVLEMPSITSSSVSFLVVVAAADVGNAASIRRENLDMRAVTGIHRFQT